MKKIKKIFIIILSLIIFDPNFCYAKAITNTYSIVKESSLDKVQKIIKNDVTQNDYLVFFSKNDTIFFQPSKTNNAITNNYLYLKLYLINNKVYIFTASDNKSSNINKKLLSTIKEQKYIIKKNNKLNQQFNDDFNKFIISYINDKNYFGPEKTVFLKMSDKSNHKTDLIPSFKELNLESKTQNNVSITKKELVLESELRKRNSGFMYVIKNNSENAILLKNLNIENSLSSLEVHKIHSKYPMLQFWNLMGSAGLLLGLLTFGLGSAFAIPMIIYNGPFNKEAGVFMGNLPANYRLQGNSELKIYVLTEINKTPTGNFYFNKNENDFQISL